MENMRVWIGEQAAYNNGHLVGKWVDLPFDDDEIDNILNDIKMEAQKAIGEEIDGEFYIGDTENIPFDVGEWDKLQDINKKALEIENFGETEMLAFQAMMKEGMDFDEAVEKVNNGEYSVYYDCYTMTDVAMAFDEETGYFDDVPEEKRRYINYEMFGRDLEIEGHFVYMGNAVYVEIHY